jgi:pimeloyl-ACP methyl ester carboxylesterase
MVERRRGAITDATHPMAGDVLLYLSRGEQIREFIRACCRDATPPVVLLAHSLGGIACLDLLATHDIPGVVQLVTVGSQAPFLYELNALPSLPYGRPLRPDMPAWTNFYDPRDLLAYVGEKVFPGRVTDVPVSSGNPFPFAHSDYFGNPGFYDRLGKLLP